MKTIDLYPHVCKQCGKHFEGSSKYSLKLPKGHSKYDYFCKWSCIQAFRMEKEKAKKEKAKAKRGEAS